MVEKAKKWELKMHEARELKKQGAGLLYDRVKLLVECYDDPAFREWHETNRTNELDFLDEELSDVAASFLTMKAVLTEHPERDAWIKHGVRQLIALAIDAENERRRRESEDGKRISWKERALAAEKECERLRAEIANMKESLGIVASAKCQ